jgi:hypothetical protein
VIGVCAETAAQNKTAETDNRRRADMRYSSMKTPIAYQIIKGFPESAL